MMSRTVVRFLIGLCAAASIVGAPICAVAQEPKKADAQESKKVDADIGKFDAENGDGVARYCANIAPVVVESRIAWEMKRLKELEDELKEKMTALDAKETEARDWVNKRQDLLSRAEDDIVAIYAKMKPEASAAQMNVMDDASAAAILSKLNPRAASAILGEMEAERATKLTDIISGVRNGPKPPTPPPSPDADGDKS
jgi:flagellar motility protein MotE (MotC chaperone)